MNNLFVFIVTTFFIVPWRNLNATEQNNLLAAIAQCMRNNDYSLASHLYDSNKKANIKLDINTQISILNSLGVLASRTFHEHAAMEFYKRGLQLVAQTDDSAQLCAFVDNIAALYVRAGDVINASSYLKMGELLYQQLNKPLPVSFLNNMGTNMFYQDEINKAKEYHKIACQRLQQSYGKNIPIEYQGIIFNLVWDYVALKEYDKALNILNNMFGESDNVEIESRKLYVEALTNKTGKVLDKAVLLLARPLSTSAFSYIHLTLAEIARQDGQWNKCAEELILAFNANLNKASITDLCTNMPPQHKSIQHRYMLIADALCRAGNTSEAWNWLQLANFQAEKELILKGSADTLESVVATEKLLFNLRSQKNIEEDAPSQTTYTDFIVLEQNYENAKNNLRMLNPRLWESLFSERVNVHPDDLDQIRHYLPQDTVLIEVVTLESQIAFFICSANNPVLLKTIPLNNAEKRIKGMVIQYRQAMSSPGNISEAQSIGEKLYNLLIAPIQDELKELKPKTILFSPAGFLRYVSFATLYDGEHFIVEQYNTANLSGYDLIRLGVKEEINDAKISFIAFSNPDGTLPASERECQDISKQFEVATVYSQNKATLKQFLALSGNASFVHIATHGVLNSEHPEESYLVFADEILKYKDMVAGLPKMTNLDMLTLSACNTANVNPSIMNNNALEIYGIAYQFVRKTNSGATLATLWPVSDEHTRQLMTTCYKHMLDNAKESRQWLRAQSLSDTQRKMISSTETSHPFFWGAFIIIGNFR